jgi:hypothetical protein
VLVGAHVRADKFFLLLLVLSDILERLVEEGAIRFDEETSCYVPMVP